MSNKQIWLYHKDFPEGKLFDLAEADEKMKQMLADGWVDTPAKLKTDYQPTNTEISAIATMSKEQIVEKCESLGFHVFDTEQLKEMDNSDDKLLSDYSDKALVDEVRSRGITYKPSKDEILEFCADYGINVVQEPSLIELFSREPTNLTKEELVIVGNGFDLKLKMTMKEATMIGHIEKRIKELQTDPA